MAILFDKLVSALTDAVVRAQHDLRKAQIDTLWRYFEQDPQAPTKPDSPTRTENGPPTRDTYSPIPVVFHIPRVSHTTRRQAPPPGPQEPPAGRQEPPQPDRQEPQLFSVPLITLVHPSQLSIKHMKITMQVDMSELDMTKSPDAASAEASSKESTKEGPAPHYRWAPSEYKPMLAAATTSGKQAGQIGTAQVTLTVTAGELPEGLSRLLEHYNKCL